VIKDKIKKKLENILKDFGYDYQFKVEVPDENFGDFSTNVALVGAKYFKKSPMDIAQKFADRLQSSELFDDISIAGPGFINFKVKGKVLQEVIKKILNERESFGKKTIGNGMRIQIEYASANPTGPLTVAHGRQIVIGDALVNIFKEMGYEVQNEVYLNDAGRQISLLAKSLWVRYNQLLGSKYEIPEDGYKGDYLIDVARKLLEEVGEKYKDRWDIEVEEFFKSYALKEMINSMFETFKLMKSSFDNVFSEKSLIDDGTVDKVLEIFKKRDLLYEKDGAIWLKVSQFVDDNDKVLIRKDGTPTYFMTDIAYHYNKWMRGFDRVYDIWGSDHQGHIPRMKAAMKALGFDDNFFNVILHQFVTLRKDGKNLRMSTRAGRFITLNDLINEVGVDAARYFFARIDPSTPLIFDIDLALKRSMENPVYYVQYAHARICSLFRQAEEKNIEYKDNLEVISLLNNEDERKLMKTLDLFEDALYDAYVSFSPARITGYLEELAHDFHQFYTKNIILDIANRELSLARLHLSKATQIVIRKGLRLLGITAPERM